MPAEEDRAAATFNRHGKFGEVELCGFKDMRADRQTNSSQYLALLDRGEVTRLTS